MKIITGIGSRETPTHILEEMTKIGEWIKSNNMILRSGHADGADWAFEQGAQENSVIYLPWKSFNDHLISRANYVVIELEDKYNELTNKFHPYPKGLSRGARLLMNRNSCQILGKDLDEPTDVIIYWALEDKKGNAIGGTGQAIRIAKSLNIPMYNMLHHHYSTFNKIIELL